MLCHIGCVFNIEEDAEMYMSDFENKVTLYYDSIEEEFVAKSNYVDIVNREID